MLSEGSGKPTFGATPHPQVPKPSVIDPDPEVDHQAQVVEDPARINYY